MPRQDTVDFLTAFAVGAVLGVGATLLLQPQQSPRDRINKQLQPYRKQMRRSYKRVSKGIKEGSDATSGMTTEVIGAGRELLAEFRSEVGEILEQARAEMSELVSDQVKDAGKAARRVRRRMKA